MAEVSLPNLSSDTSTHTEHHHTQRQVEEANELGMSEKISEGRLGNVHNRKRLDDEVGVGPPQFLEEVPPMIKLVKGGNDKPKLSKEVARQPKLIEEIMETQRVQSPQGTN